MPEAGGGSVGSLLLAEDLWYSRGHRIREARAHALLHALRCEHKIVGPRHYGLSQRQLRARAEEIATGNWASEAVRKAIEEIIAAVAATSAAAAASAGSG